MNQDAAFTFSLLEARLSLWIWYACVVSDIYNMFWQYGAWSRQTSIFCLFYGFFKKAMGSVQKQSTVELHFLEYLQSVLNCKKVTDKCEYSKKYFYVQYFYGIRKYSANTNLYLDLILIHSNSVSAKERTIACCDHASTGY